MTDRNGVFLVPCRRRSSMTLINKAEEYAMRTARSELMFTRLKERNGLMKTVFEKLRKYLYEVRYIKRIESVLYPVTTKIFAVTEDGFEEGTAEQLSASLAKASPQLRQCVISCKHIAETARQQNNFQNVRSTIIIIILNAHAHAHAHSHVQTTYID